MEEPIFATPAHEVHLEIAIERTLAASPYAAVWPKGIRHYTLENEQNGGHKVGTIE